MSPKTAKIVAYTAFSIHLQRFTHDYARQTTSESSIARFPRDKIVAYAVIFCHVSHILRIVRHGRPLAKARRANIVPKTGEEKSKTSSTDVV